MSLKKSHSLSSRKDSSCYSHIKKDMKIEARRHTRRTEKQKLKTDKEQ